MIYNSLIWHHIKYFLRARGTNCNSIELLQKKTVIVINFKSPFDHTEPRLKGMYRPKLFDIYACQLMKLYYKLYQNWLPVDFESFLPEYGEF